MGRLQNKQIVLGVSGGIAAYKVAELVRLLCKSGASVRVVMTAAAQEFITPLTMQALSGNPVHTQLLNPEAEAGMGHIELARWAELIVIAPASADLLARLATGRGDDLLTTVCLASAAPVAVAPAMNQAMWRHPATSANVATLRQRHVSVWGPEEGAQACGDVGPGRMLEPAQLLTLVEQQCSSASLAGKTVVITAGPTREAIDPVRYISNHSSGKMGYAMAESAAAAGAIVKLISGPTALPAPAKVMLHKVESAEQMLALSLELAASADVFIAAAAVADYRPLTRASHKLKKDDGETMHITLTKNPDIVASVANLPQRPFTVGFAAETENLEQYAQAKLQRKNLDIIIANDVSNPDIGFNSDDNAVVLIDRQGQQLYSQRSKRQLASELILEIASRLHSRQSEV